MSNDINTIKKKIISVQNEIDKYSTHLRKIKDEFYYIESELIFEREKLHNLVEELRVKEGLIDFVSATDDLRDAEIERFKNVMEKNLKDIDNEKPLIYIGVGGINTDQ